MIGRIAWYAALLVVALVTTAVQLDRQSAIAPIYASVTPEPVRGFAQARLTSLELAVGSNEQAVAEATKLVERRPMPAETLRLLAQAQFAAGQTDEGFITIQYAAQRGWRDAVAQETMLRLAVAAGDEAEAAKRYTALFLKKGTEDALLLQFGEVLFDSPEGPATQTLVDIVSGGERWNTTFLRRGSRVIPAQSFAEIVARSSENGADFDCAILSDVAQSVARRDDAAGARLETLVDQRC